MQLTRFPKSDIISLVGETPRYNLGESTGPDLRLAELLAEPEQVNLHEMLLGYGTPEGDAQLRQVIADAHGVSAEHVITTVGGMHALFLLAFILCNRADEVVTTAPLFPSTRNTLEVVGARVRVLPLSFEQGYQLDLADLREHLSASTRLVSLASPQNPSGVAISTSTIKEILALLAERCPDAYLLVDETYREAVYGDDPLVQSMVTLSPKVISVASLSKCHGAPGLRLGWAITQDPALYKQLVLGKFTTVVSCPPVCEVLALQVFAQREQIIAERRQLLAQGLTQTAEWIAENQEWVEWVRPDAGALCCVRLKPSIFHDDQVARFYATLASKGVMVANGTWFGDEARVFRLGFGHLSMSDLHTALEILSSVLQHTAQAAI